MAKNGKLKTIAVIVSCAIIVAGTWTGFIIAGNNVKNTADGAKESVVELKQGGCDPVHDIDKRCLVLETKWEVVVTSQKEIKTGQTVIIKGQEKILEALAK